MLDPESTRSIAQRRLKHTQRRLALVPELQRDYCSFMAEYEDLKHMRLVPQKDVHPVSSYYLPHHAVIRDNNTTTRLRVVFDASAKCCTGLSLNDHLLVGPTLQDGIFSILLRFRTHLIALTADVNKMYRQIRVHESDTKYQHVLWSEDSQTPIRDYKLLTVTYGTSSAPYLATKCLQQLAHDEREKFPEAAAVALKDFYIDDLMSGSNSTSAATKLRTAMSQLMSCGGFELRKWSSNSDEVLSSIPEHLRHTQLPLQIDVDATVKTLGLLWNPKGDQFAFSTASLSEASNRSADNAPTTKRTLLSSMAKMYDPLGWLSPVTVKAKIMFQQLWRQPTAWDESLPERIHREWRDYLKGLKALENIRINRCLFSQISSTYELHGFCDASVAAYAAVVYLRSTHCSGLIEVSIAAAKTRVAPIKLVSLPRLELCGAVLLAKLLSAVKEALCLPIQKVYGWTDSTVALAWIQACPSRWKTFVANRVSEIQEHVPADNWYHVKGTENPADSASRGIKPDQLEPHPTWWQGPLWLKELRLPLFKRSETTHEELKGDKSVALSGTVNEPNPLLARYSDLNLLNRVTAQLFRFIHNCRTPADLRRSGPLTVPELAAAQRHWIKIAQEEAFGEERRRLTTDKALDPRSRLLCLSPFIDAAGILRVGGRLRNANLNVEAKFPILLPKAHPLTQLIVVQEHLRTLHGGPQLLLASLRERYWILNGRDVTRRCVKNCVVCCRHRAQLVQPKMADLPASRTVASRPFARCGVDYAGPVSLRLSRQRGRGKGTTKAYIAIFVCFSTRAMHLELVGDLSTDAFIAALKRFVSRRGHCSDIYSDCGTNFVGANKELKLFLKLTKSQVHNERITQQLSEGGTTWHFNPPAAPHFGGLWEAGVKSVKFHLRRVIGTAILNFEEMYTLLTQVEACLNSRPLCPLSSEPDDLAALTPGHFLIGGPLNAIPEPDYTHLKISRLSRWQLMQQMLQHFWIRWQREYLSRLQQRPRSWTRSSEVKAGELVLIKDEKQAPSKWALARIVALHPGADGEVRVVTVKTASGIFRRPVVKLCKLPIE